MQFGEPPGAVRCGENQYRFRLWAPLKESVDLHIIGPQDRLISLRRNDDGYFTGIVDALPAGSLYRFRLEDGAEYPDPASRCQPRGVHGPSQLVDERFGWEDEKWVAPDLRKYILYEVHIGTFTRQGTFGAAIRRLPHLKRLGVTAVELMPVAQFPGNRNWGYDGVYCYAVQNSYGGPAGLKRFVNACHQLGLAVVMDVVYNHLGPEGNYLNRFAPYCTGHYRTSWGPALNFDGPYSDGVREFFLQNALYWLDQFHVDALRLDATHSILDLSPLPFLESLSAAVEEKFRQQGRNVYLIAENDRNDPRLIFPRDQGGMGLHAMWNDDFHHSLHALLTGEREGCYVDFGGTDDLAKAFRHGFVFTGRYSRHRHRTQGRRPPSVLHERLVVFSQNHDQIGNRADARRLTGLVSFEALKLIAAAVLLSPFLPLIFMGEEYGETAPFPYFISHSDPNLIEAVRRARKDESACFGWKGEPQDPQDEATFMSAKLRPLEALGRKQRRLYALYRELIRLRKECVAAPADPRTLEATAHPDQQLVRVEWDFSGRRFCLLLHFGADAKAVPLALPGSVWERIFDSSESRWSGPGTQVPRRLNSARSALLNLQPHSCLLLKRVVES